MLELEPIEKGYSYEVPYKLGQKVYYIHGNRIVKAEVTALIINENGVEMELYFYIDGYYRNYVNESCINKSIFNNRKAAERALND